MTRIYTTTTIARPLEEVFDFVTTPGNWPQWHPSSRGVSGATDHSLEVGERCTEGFLVAGRTGEVVWTVIEREAPYRWVIDGEIVGRSNGGVISYDLARVGHHTRFERTFEYDTPGLIFTLLDRLIFRRRVERESAVALRQLKRVLEEERVPQ